MASLWGTFPLFLLLSAVSALAASSAFENTAVVRTVQLGGSVVHVTTTFAIRALEDDAQVYKIALPQQEYTKVSLAGATLKEERTALSFEENLVDATKDYRFLDITLPKALRKQETLNIVFETTLVHATYPWPKTAKQGDEQALKYTTHLFVPSPYVTAVQRTKLKANQPQFISYTTPDNVQDFTEHDPVSKSGATVVYGPFKDIPVSTSSEFVAKYQQSVTVHYKHPQPVMEILSYERDVEISHWGANLNTQDQVTLHNAGPVLKGHFSRLEYQQRQFQSKPSPHIIPRLQLLLPAGIRDAYFYDLVGNVSTSNLRIAPSIPHNQQGSKFSTLELMPRYPLFGGWNYSFTLGWDAPLGDYVSYDKSSKKYIAQIQTTTGFPGTVLDDVLLRIILPEGAIDIDYALPFPALESWISTHVTYLDTTGRPVLIFKHRDLTLPHVQNIYVSYRLPLSAHLKKPMAVSLAFWSIFSLALIGRRINLSIHAQKKRL